MCWKLSEASRERRASASPLCARMRARQGLSCRRRSLRTHLRTAWRALASGGELRPLSTQCCCSLSRAVPPRARAREAAHQTKRVRMASAGAQSTRRRARSLVVATEVAWRWAKACLARTGTSRKFTSPEKFFFLARSDECAPSLVCVRESSALDCTNFFSRWRKKIPSFSCPPPRPPASGLEPECGSLSHRLPPAVGGRRRTTRTRRSLSGRTGEAR